MRTAELSAIQMANSIWPALSVLCLFLCCSLLGSHLPVCVYRRTAWQQQCQRVAMVAIDPVGPYRAALLTNAILAAVTTEQF